MTTKVTITTGARLHFGPLAAAGTGGGKFGGVGMMISKPGFCVSGQTADLDSFFGDEPAVSRVSRIVSRIRESTSCPAMNRPIQITLNKTIPSHCGLGSGTQLGLAVSRVMSELAGEQHVDTETLARRSGRGLRSAVGLHGFARGGFLVDGGRAGGIEQLGTLVARVDFPADWRFILASPPSSTGLSGEAEITAFANQPPMSLALTGELCRIALMDWLPALIRVDFELTSSAMYEFGIAVGRFFEPAQGGVFAHPRMSQLVNELRAGGISGIAQTSWGPTLAILCKSQADAVHLRDELQSDTRWNDCGFVIVEPLNQGAIVTRSTVT